MTAQQLALFSTEGLATASAPAPLPRTPPAPIRDPAGVLLKAGWHLDPQTQTRGGATWRRGDDTLVLPHAALDHVAAWVRANPRLTAAVIEQRRALLTPAAPAATPAERAERRQEARCAQCGRDLRADPDWFVWGPLGDFWCCSCSAAAGADTEGYT